MQEATPGRVAGSFFQRRFREDVKHGKQMNVWCSCIQSHKPGPSGSLLAIPAFLQRWVATLQRVASAFPGESQAANIEPTGGLLFFPGLFEMTERYTDCLGYENRLLRLLQGLVPPCFSIPCSDALGVTVTKPDHDSNSSPRLDPDTSQGNPSKENWSIYSGRMSFTSQSRAHSSIHPLQVN